MKKLITTIALSALVCMSVFADYKSPAGGQNLLRLSEPQLLTDGTSAAGGPIFDITPSAVVNNPALTAYEQRIIADVAGTLLLDSNDTGFAGQAGLLIPSRWGVSSFLIQGVFAELEHMPLGNNFNVVSSFSKDVTNELAVGTSLNFGFFKNGSESDWKAGLNLGAFYNYGKIGPLTKTRFGASLLNLGKMYSAYDLKWPGIATLKAGGAATFFENQNFEMGASLDLSAPGFQDFVMDAGLQIEIAKMLKISTAWEYDAREFSNGHKNILPSIGLNFKFRFNSKEGSMLANNGWAESDMTISAAWKQMYEEINAVSAGAVLKLGLEDTTPPKIILWGEE